MLGSKNIKKPHSRSRLRKLLGKQYFIAKRKLLWLAQRKKFAKTRENSTLPYLIFEHSSILLRPLKDVDMQYQYNKTTNLKLAIEKLQGIIIQPGQTFSLWHLVGKPSKSRGYLKGLVLTNGQIGYDYGGGLCQLGNLIYWIIIHSDLKVTERYRHGYDVFPDINRKIPFGSGATLSYNYVDLQITNTTQKQYQLHFEITTDRLVGRLYSQIHPERSYEVYESEHLFKQEYWGGYTRHNILRRKVFNQLNERIDDEYITENHAIMMYNPMLPEQH